VNVSPENDASSIATVSAVRTAARNELLAAKAAAAITAIPGLAMNANVINELHSASKAQEFEEGKRRTTMPELPPVTS
jgi:hypothetical protein